MLGGVATNHVHKNDFIWEIKARKIWARWIYSLNQIYKCEYNISLRISNMFLLAFFMQPKW
jgi:hypothetical protein